MTGRTGDMERQLAELARLGRSLRRQEGAAGGGIDLQALAHFAPAKTAQETVSGRDWARGAGPALGDRLVMAGGGAPGLTTAAPMGPVPPESASTEAAKPVMGKALAAELERRGAPADVAQQAAGRKGLDAALKEERGEAAANVLDKKVTLREVLYMLGVKTDDLGGKE